MRQNDLQRDEETFSQLDLQQNVGDFHINTFGIQFPELSE